MTRVMKNTLMSVLVLFVISAVSVLLLSLANYFIKPVIKLDAKTVAIINKVAPTGLPDAEAESRIKIVDLADGEYNIKSLDDFNKSSGSSSTVMAVFTSANAAGQKTIVVQSSAKGRDGDIVMVTSFTADGKVLATDNKSNNESYWTNVSDWDEFFAAYKGLSGNISSNDILANTGATIKITVSGITDAVNIAIKFNSQLGGMDTTPKKEPVTNASIIAMLKELSGATEFTKYPVTVKDKISAVYEGDNGDLIYEALGNGGTYGKVTLLCTVSQTKTLVKAVMKDNSFTPIDGVYDSDKITSEFITDLFAGKTAAEIKGQSGQLVGATGATESANGVRQALVNAIEYDGNFDKEEW